MDFSSLVYRLGHRFSTKLVSPSPFRFLFFNRTPPAKHTIPHTHTSMKHGLAECSGHGRAREESKFVQIQSLTLSAHSTKPPSKNYAGRPLGRKFAGFQTFYPLSLTPNFINCSLFSKTCKVSKTRPDAPEVVIFVNLLMLFGNSICLHISRPSKPFKLEHA